MRRQPATQGWCPERLLPAVLLLAAGCQQEQRPLPVEVKGKVLDAGGKPLTGALLVFHPQEEGNRSHKPSAILHDKEGQFRILCLKGLYKVTVTFNPISDAGDAPGSSETKYSQPSAPLPERFQDLDQTPWRVTVPDNGREDVVLTLKD